MVNIPKEHNSLKKVYVDTTNVATQIDSPKVYYKIIRSERFDLTEH